ncbi:hypothetical protein BJ917_6139 [Pseudomonas sp. WPR_5_2]|nr:hypothetical protein BJ917_6139 [Pseudomonas sp. WPR_5_2]
MTARLGRPVRLTSSKATDGCSFSYTSGRSELYDLESEKRVEIVAGDVQGVFGSLMTINNPETCRSEPARDGRER